MNKKSFSLRFFLLFFSGIFLTSIVSGQSLVKFFSFELASVITESPLSVKLTWTPNLSANSIKIRKKLKGDKVWGSFETLDSKATGYTDNSIEKGKIYEYHVVRNLSYIGNKDANQYITVAIEPELVDYRGKLLLLIESSMSSLLKTQTDRLELDLIGDGWQVIRKEFPLSETAINVKAWIKSEYDKDPTNVKSVFIIGNVAVPYSGNFGPDGHGSRAWPADGYYGEMNGTWTDITVNNTTWSSTLNRNIPGDGKFDQDYFPSDVELQVGRVDLSRLPRFKAYDNSINESELLIRYLNKNHEYRTRQVDFPKRGMLQDEFQVTYGENFATSCWGSYFTLLGYNNAYEKNFRTNRNDGYLWAHASGPGSNTSAGSVVTTDDFAPSNVSYDYVFLFMFGSYFGDWNPSDNLMRSALASKGYILSAVWSGRPYWWFHHLGSGETLGYSAIVNQNNKTLYFANSNTNQVHISLLGDPSLRTYMIAPPTKLKDTVINNHVQLSWQHSPDVILGYHVYKASSIHDKFNRITSSIITENNYTDPSAVSGNYVYQVRAIKKEINNSGIFYNNSRGAIASNIDTIIDAEIIMHPPYIVDTIPTVSILESISYAYDLNNYIADDGLGDVLSYQMFELGKTTMPTGWTFNTSSLNLICNKPIKGSYTFVIKATDKQLFSVSDTFSIYVKTSLSDPDPIINSEIKNQVLFVYPNPSDGKFNLKVSSDYRGNAQISIIDVSGKKCKILNIDLYEAHQQIAVDVSELHSGLYMIFVETPEYSEKTMLLLQ